MPIEPTPTPSAPPRVLEPPPARVYGEAARGADARRSDVCTGAAPAIDARTDALSEVRADVRTEVRGDARTEVRSVLPEVDRVDALPLRKQLAALLALAESAKPAVAEAARVKARALVTDHLPPLVFEPGGRAVRRFAESFAEATRKTMLGFELRGSIGAVHAELDRLASTAERAPFSPSACLDAVERAERALARYLSDRPGTASKRPWAEALAARLEGAHVVLGPLVRVESACRATTALADVLGRAEDGRETPRTVERAVKRASAELEGLGAHAPVNLLAPELTDALVGDLVTWLAAKPITDARLGKVVGELVGRTASLEVRGDLAAKDQWTNEVVGRLEVTTLAARTALLEGLFDAGVLDASMVRELLVHRSMGLDLETPAGLFDRADVLASPTYGALVASAEAALARATPAAPRDPERVRAQLAAEPSVQLVLTLWAAARDYAAEAPSRAVFGDYLAAVERLYADASARGEDTSRADFLTKAAQFDAAAFRARAQAS
ncbi:hypothetical protein L6R52_16150 [Myxococcota bacterium]|nr:hypothetical protein [Myxococcota bacterium]